MSWLDTVSRSSVTTVQFDAPNRASAAVSGPVPATTPGGPATAPSAPGATGAARLGAARAGAAPGASGDSTFAQLVSVMNQGQQSNAELLTLQQKMQEQDRYFTSVSNVLKARHETMKSTISNLS